MAGFSSTELTRSRHINGQFPGPALSRRAWLGQVLVAGALVVTGCRTPTTAGPPPTLNVLALEPPVSAVAQLISQQAESAAKEAGVRVNWQFLAQADLTAALTRANAAGQPPATALVGSTDSTPNAAKGLLVEVREPLNRISGLNGDLFPPLNDLTLGGPFVDVPSLQKPPVWAIPYVSLGGAWLVRNDLLKKQQLSAPKTFADVATVAAALTGSSDVYGWGGSLPLNEATDNLVQIALLDHGATLFDARGLRVTVDPNAAIAGFTALARLYRTDSGSPLAPSSVVDWSVSDTATAFAGGQVAQTIDPGGLYAQLLQSDPNLRDSIVALPPPAGPKDWFTASATSLFVVFRGATAEKATALVERILQPARYDALIRAGQGSVIPPYSYSMRAPFWDDDPNYPVYAANVRGDPSLNFHFATLGQPAPLTLPVAAVRGARLLADLGRAVARGEQTPATAAAALVERAQVLARGGLASQPPPSPTPQPTWLRMLQSAAQSLK